MKKDRLFYLVVFALLVCLMPLGALAGDLAAVPVEGDVITPSDYAEEANWLALAQNPEMPVDIFVLYPTAWSRLEDEPVLCAIDRLEMQERAQAFLDTHASAFTTLGNVFAPLYRQLDAAFLLALPQEEQLPYIKGAPKTDVLAAFEYYWEHYNNGRPFVLVAHSQGSTMAKELLFDYMRDRPEIMEQMVAAYVIGYSVTQAELDANPHVRFAEGPDDTGVIISYNTEAPEIGGESTTWLEGSVAINPISWSRGEELAPVSDSLGSMVSVDGEYTKVEHLADARVDTGRGVVVCESVDPAVYSVPEAMRSIFPEGVYHSMDIPFYYFNLRENAENRINHYLGTH